MAHTGRRGKSGGRIGKPQVGSTSVEVEHYLAGGGVGLNGHDHPPVGNEGEGTFTKYSDAVSLPAWPTLEPEPWKAAFDREAAECLWHQGQRLMSKNELLLIWQPAITLYADASPSSRQAHSLLVEAGLRFEVAALDGQPVPAVVWYGVVFQGLDKIATLAQRLGRANLALEASFTTHLPEAYRQGDSLLQSFMEALRQFQVYESRHRLEMFALGAERSSHQTNQ